MARTQCLIWIALLTLSPTFTTKHHKTHNLNQEVKPKEETIEDSVRNQVMITGQLHITPPQRVNQRSIKVDTTVQNVEEDLKEDRTPKYQNGTSKILNHVSTTSEIKLNNRRGVATPLVAPRRGNTEAVIFPGPVSRISAPDELVIPEECKKSGICENIPNYPHDEVEVILKSLGDKVDLMQIDELLTPEISQRTGHPDDIQLCLTYEGIIYPQAAQSKDDKWRIILNRPGKHAVQGFRVEMCSGRAECDSIADFKMFYKGVCKQKYMLRHAWTKDENNQPTVMAFKIPSCCSCVVVPTDDYS